MNIPDLNEKQLEEIIDAFSNCTEIPITVFDKDMNIITESMSENKICKFFDIYNKNSICAKNLAFSAKISFELGESYIFLCPSGLTNIAVPIIVNKKFEGCFIAGPMAMGPIKENNINTILELNNNNHSLFSKITLFIRKMKIYSPTQVNKLSILLYNNILSLYCNRKDYEFMKAQYKSQNQIGEKIQKYKKEKKIEEKKIEEKISFNIQKELIEKVKAGDSECAHEILKGLLNEILVVEVGNFEIMKVRIFELYVALSRAAVECGASLQKIFGINFDLIDSLNQIKSIQDLSSWATSIIDYFIKNVFVTIYSGQSYIITQAVQHINSNYMSKLSLRSLSNYLHINESYLSKLFKQEMGINFTDYLNKTRINKSLELIRDTDMNLLDIAVCVGFEDQSYFTKIFKKIVGDTPKRYKIRRINKQN